MSNQTAPSDSPNLQKLGSAAADEVRRTVRTALTEVMANFLMRLPGELAEASPKASNPQDRTLFQDLSRALPAKAQSWVNAFAQKVDAHLIGGLEPARGSDEADAPAGVDDSLALANVELRAEERYQKLITELDARFNRIRLTLYVPVFSKALAPASLVRSLQETADAMQWPTRHRRFLMEKFDAIVVPQLERLYRALIAALTRIGTEAAKAAETAHTKPISSPPVAPPRPPQSATTMQAPQDPRRLDAESVGMLQQLALKADGDGYTDGLLAADLLALAESKPLPGVMQDQSWIPIQRISLAGHFLNVVISDAMVPDELKPTHESVRFPLMKSALTDDTLFTSRTHPLGSLIHELLLKSATSRVTGNVETRRMAELLQQVLVQFDLAPEFVRQAMRGSSPIQETQIQRFFELQRQQAQQRRDFVIAEAKRVVVRELEQATFGRNIPAPGIRFLNMAWGPLLTKRLLQHGADSALWKAALQQMEKLLDLLEARQPGEAPTQEWKELLQAMGQALVAEGMAQDKVRESLQAVDASRATPVTAVAV